ncbi:hypothetical protein GCM10010327_32460 [Streptomyces nitrosporeus]|nr:hypothetical protein GCM10010327_32460 [Streptomyces nitrosporeus]
MDRHRTDSGIHVPKGAERTMSWLSGRRWPDHHYEPQPDNRLVLPGLAAALCRYGRLLEPAMQEKGL